MDIEQDDHNNMMMEVGKKRLSEAEAKKWNFYLMNDPEQYEKETFVDRINELNFIIKEFQKLYEKTLVTDHLFRAKVQKEIEHSKRILSKVQAEYEIFKKYKRELQ
jgi:hypothetical protein